MATFNNNWLVLTVIIVHALSATSYVDSVGRPTEVATCARQLDKKCGKEILLKVSFNDGNPSVDCCMELSVMGKTCHDKLVKTTLSSSPQYQENSKAILARSQSTWSQCHLTVHSSAPHNKSCPLVSDLTCRQQIFSRVFHSQGELSNDRCGVFVEIGKDCHDKLVSKHVVSAKLGSNKTAILGRSMSVWNWCSYVTRSLPSVKACETKIDDECGKEIGLGVFYGKGQVTKGCCLKLARMGTGCHDRWVKTNLAWPEFVKSSNAILDRRRLRSGRNAFRIFKVSHAS